MPSCYGCSMCCTMLSVKELDKPAGVPCKHLNGHRCGIYDERPESCRKYKCVYLQSKTYGRRKFTSSMRPSKCHVIFEPTRGATGGLLIKVDPKHRNAYLKGAVARFIVGNPQIPMLVRTEYTGPGRAVNKAGVDLCHKYNTDPDNVPGVDMTPEKFDEKLREQENV